MSGGICIGDVTRDLLGFKLFSCEGKRNGWLVSVLRGEVREIDGIPFEPWSRSGLEPADPKP
jgi:hypothetical protein